MTAEAHHTFNPEAFAPGERFDAWRYTVNSAFVPLEAAARHPEAYSAHLVGQHIGSVEATEVGGDPVRIRRTRRTIMASDPGIYKFALQITGRCLVRQEGREAALQPGDLAVYDTARPYDLDCEVPYRMFVMQIPRHELGLHEDQTRQLTAERIPGGSGLAALTSSLLAGMDQQLRDGELTAEPRAAAGAVQLIQATLRQQMRPESAETPAAEVLHLQALRFIGERISDPGLSVSTIAPALHVSVRYLQKLFAASGTTVSDLIRERRLEGCRVELIDPASATRPVAAVAASWGFIDASSFSRAFRQQYGMTPSQYRSSAGPGGREHVVATTQPRVVARAFRP
ncbi:helix-turn-helix domain-containing protein [Nesterenkonia populi]|uniref:AraC-like ligand-binding domain-containing protein n=1 Tax=Nesterenkonia populi TaxID=1591087 RepID=UPI0011BE1D75|nr:helix-turn-helix domain-containing protein [Nesterenkonia populi]